MLKNMNYDLTEELAQRSKMVWRYDQYAKDAEAPECGNCQNIWQRLKEQDESSINMIKEEIESHVQNEMFD